MQEKIYRITSLQIHNLALEIASSTAKQQSKGKSEGCWAQNLLVQQEKTALYTDLCNKAKALQRLPFSSPVMQP